MKQWPPSPEIDIHVISCMIARVVHLHEPPVSPFAGYPERHITFAFAGFAAVDVIDLCDDRTRKREFPGADFCDDAVDRDVIVVLLAFLFSFDGQSAVLFRNNGLAEVVPAYPLEGQEMFSQQLLFRLIIVAYAAACRAALLSCPLLLAHHPEYAVFLPEHEYRVGVALKRFFI